MAKTQNLSLNPQKVSGVCGRLMCCLAYEQESYQALRKRMPRVGKNVTTPRGPGRITEIDILRQEVRVTFPDGMVVLFDAPSVHVVPGGAGDDRDLDEVPEELRHLEDVPSDGHRVRVPVEGREIVTPQKGGGRRKPWQDGRVPGGSAPRAPGPGEAQGGQGGRRQFDPRATRSFGAPRPDLAPRTPGETLPARESALRVLPQDAKEQAPGVVAQPEDARPGPKPQKS